MGASSALANEPDPVLSLDRRLSFEPPSGLGMSNRQPSYLSGNRVSGQVEDRILLESEASLRQLGSSLKADRIDYDLVGATLKAMGNVRLYRNGEIYRGPALDLDLATNEGSFNAVEYEMPTANARGKAETLKFLGPSLTELGNASLSTCPADLKAWRLEADQLLLDQISETAYATDARLVWEGLGELPLGDVSFPTSSRRRSGILPPTYSATSRNGLEVMVPYYWNIAPNRDATFFPKLIAKRGVQLGSELRYLDTDQSGVLGLEVLPEDKLTNTTRSLGSIRHVSNLGGGTSLSLVGTRVSDANYFSDFGNSLLTTSQRVLPATLTLSSGLAGWGVAIQAQEFQLLQDPQAPIIQPYAWLPRITAGRSLQFSDLPGLGQAALLDLNTQAELTSFRHPTLTNGDRAVVYSSLGLPSFAGPFQLTPRISGHATGFGPSRDGSALETQAKYGLSPAQLGTLTNNAGVVQGYSRFVPTASLDTGFALERDTQWSDQAMVQTLEPRVFYAYTPYRDQSRQPVFDTALAGLNFAQLFSERPYVGQDRVADQNQITTGLTSRFLNGETGEERLRVGLGQRFYLQSQRVTLPGQAVRADRESDVLGEFSARLGQYVSLDGFAQYTQQMSRWQAAVASLSYSPRKGDVFSTAYRFTRDSVNAVDFAFQTPIAESWYGVARVNRSLQRRDANNINLQPGLIESILGVEYNGGNCWAFRAVGQRFVTAANTRTTAIFLQVELTGVARLGSDPLGALRRGIPGYTPVNAIVPLPSQYENYP